MYTKFASTIGMLLTIAAIAALPQNVSGQITHIGDVRIDGSLDVGIDSTGTSFGFDTIRLKENNLRLFFDDTSTAASFPANDWRIVINSSANGGGAFFGVEDATAGRTPFRVDAGAPSNALRVDSQGDVGLGVDNPVVELHVRDGDTPTLRLEQDGSSGFTPQTWDLAGNETNFFIRDVTNASKLPFRIRPNAPTSSIDVAADGDVNFLGSNSSMEVTMRSPDGGGNYSQLTFERGTADTWGMGNEDTQFYIFNYDRNDYSISVNEATGNVGFQTTSPDHDFEIHEGSAYSEIDAGETMFSISSSRSLKENLQPVSSNGILEKMSDIGVYTYDFIDGGKDRLGLMAEDFHQVFERGSDKLISGQEVQMALWLSVQELEQRTRAQQDRIAELEAMVEKIKTSTEE